MIEVEERTEQATEPAKRWRNRWRQLKGCFCLETRTFDEPGDYWGARLWPSKDTAESAAQKAMEYNEIHGPGYVEYLGAFPVEDAP